MVTVSGVSCNFLSLYSQSHCFNGLLTFRSHTNCSEKFLQYSYVKPGSLFLKLESSALNTYSVAQAVLLSEEIGHDNTFLYCHEIQLNAVFQPKCLK